MAESHDLWRDDRLVESLSRGEVPDLSDPAAGPLLALTRAAEGRPLPTLDADALLAAAEDRCGRRYAVRSLAVAVAVVATLSTSGVAAVVSGDPLRPAKAVWQHIQGLGKVVTPEGGEGGDTAHVPGRGGAADTRPPSRADRAAGAREPRDDDAGTLWAVTRPGAADRTGEAGGADQADAEAEVAGRSAAEEAGTVGRISGQGDGGGDTQRTTGDTLARDGSADGEDSADGHRQPSRPWQQRPERPVVPEPPADGDDGDRRGDAEEPDGADDPDDPDGPDPDNPDDPGDPGDTGDTDAEDPGADGDQGTDGDTGTDGAGASDEAEEARDPRQAGSDVEPTEQSREEPRGHAVAAPSRVPKLAEGAERRGDGTAAPPGRANRPTPPRLEQTVGVPPAAAGLPGELPLPG